MRIDDFEKKISSGNILVYFYADWCGKCKMISLELKKIDNLNIVNINVDDCREICKKYLVMSVPTLIYFKKDGSYNSISGLVSSEEILDLIKK